MWEDELKKLEHLRAKVSHAVSVDGGVALGEMIPPAEKLTVQAKQGHIVSNIMLLEGILGMAMMGATPTDDVGIFCGGAVWMANQIMATLERIPGAKEQTLFRTDKKEMLPCFGFHSSGFIMECFRDWKRQTMIEIETDPGTKKMVEAVLGQFYEAERKLHPEEEEVQ